ncbi:hypothetical protein EA848_17800 [Vibrio anguillarum]|uniref:hypothetical protein n=2 Tax=Vibrio anguillarum TaxID=55601 RepID=UPI00188BCC6B|nr:hypothetical protein [Vibrio anguillarum]MBF4385598.1 hypothetical protein [Vibrio anguillarum]MBF4394864.1 hypothetical protein [Vibrio anguillarum]MBF4431424.1 hypothetical protein [Vibrio anguillarum]
MSICECEGPTKVKTSYICTECNKSVKSWQLKKKLKYIGIIGVIGYGVGQATEAVIFDNRYPMEVEFALTDACVNSSGRSLSSSQYQKKQTLCLCAVERTISDVSYSDFKSSKHLFDQNLKRNLNKC